MDINELLREGRQKFAAMCAEKAAAASAQQAAEQAELAEYTAQVMASIKTILPEAILPYLVLPTQIGPWSLSGEILLPGCAPILIEYIPSQSLMRKGYGVAAINTGRVGLDDQNPPDYDMDFRLADYTDDLMLAIGGAQERAAEMAKAAQDYARRLEERREQQATAIEAAPPYRPLTPSARLVDAFGEFVLTVMHEDAE
jgi:hypothetical protein